MQTSDDQAILSRSAAAFVFKYLSVESNSQPSVWLYNFIARWLADSVTGSRKSNGQDILMQTPCARWAL